MYLIKRYWSNKLSMNIEKNISYSFMKYIRPIWYFHLKPHDSKNSVWSQYKQLSKKKKKN